MFLKSKILIVPEEIDYLTQLMDYAEYSEVYEDVILDKEKIPLVMICNYSVFVFFHEQSNYTPEDRIQRFRSKFHVGPECFFLIISNSSFGVFDEYSKQIIPCPHNDYVRAFKNLYNYEVLAEIQKHKLDLSIPEIMNLKEVSAEQEGYVREIYSDDELEQLDKRLTAAISDDQVDDGIVVDEDGNEYMRHTYIFKLGWFNTGIPTSDRLYRISPADSNRQMLLTALLGWTGIHKFFHYKIAAGLLYLLTFGGFGVLYVVDTLEFLFGTAYYEEVTYDDSGKDLKRFKERVYYRPLNNKLRGFLLVLASLAIAVVLMRFVYFPFINSQYASACGRIGLSI